MKTLTLTILAVALGFYLGATTAEALQSIRDDIDHEQAMNSEREYQERDGLSAYEYWEANHDTTGVSK